MPEIRESRMVDWLPINFETQFGFHTVWFGQGCGSGSSGGSGSGSGSSGAVAAEFCVPPTRQRLVDFLQLKIVIDEEVVWLYFPVFSWSPRCLSLGGDSRGDIVHRDCNPPWGVPTELVVDWSGLPPECSDDPCPRTTLTYDEGEDAWFGSLALKNGTIEFRLECSFLYDPELDEYYPRWAIIVENEEGCYGSGGAEVGIVCGSPLRMSMCCLAIGPGNECCEDYSGVAYLSFTIRAANRFVDGRLIDFTDNPVFSRPQCCEELLDCDVPPACCPGIIIPDTITLTIIGSCAGGSYSLTKSGDYWVGSVPGCGTWFPGGPYVTPVRARCMPFGGGVWGWSVFGTSPPFCGFGASQTIYECNPLEVHFNDVTLYGCSALPAFDVVDMIITL